MDKLDIKVTLTREQVEELLLDLVESKLPGIPPKKIEFVVGADYEVKEVIVRLNP